jgi:hypothetical protein
VGRGGREDGQQRWWFSQSRHADPK